MADPNGNGKIKWTTWGIPAVSAGAGALFSTGLFIGAVESRIDRIEAGLVSRERIAELQTQVRDQDKRLDRLEVRIDPERIGNVVARIEALDRRLDRYSVRLDRVTQSAVRSVPGGR